MQLPRENYPAPETIIGPFSQWPRPKRTPRRKVVIYSGGVLSAAVFAHCVLPMIISA
ncbi:MAG: hypothetical protein AAFW64_09955 [Pseudomonadota bacterium]